MIEAATVAEARWLAERGCDAIIAQGLEAGGHRGMFLDDDIRMQVGTLSLVPRIGDAVQVPVIAAGGIADARGFAAALALGAAGGPLAPLRARCEATGSGEFVPLWSGQSGSLARELPAGELTRQLAEQTLARLAALAPRE